MANFVGRWVLPSVSAGLIIFAISTVIRPAQPQADPILPPAGQGGGDNVVAGLGVIEPSSEMISVASELPGVVRQVLVKPGQEVTAGTPLFRLDARSAAADVDAARASLANANAQATSARARIDTARAALIAADVAVRDAQARASLFTGVTDNRAVAQDEVDRSRYAVERARAQRAQAEAELRSAQASASAASSSARVAEAQVRVAQTALDRLTVRAPIAGRIFRVDIRPGEFAAAGPLSTPLIAMGEATTMHVRVQIDEEDVTRVTAGAKAEGTVRGSGNSRVALTFVRFEPQAVPKRNLAGGGERVDTRIIEAVYALDPKSGPVFAGQQMDVFVEATPLLPATPPAPPAS
jgi:HlyD family secretion protein